MLSITISILVIIGACLYISAACNPFETAADYLGRNMKPGIRGATINAIASSLPELFTTMSFLFIHKNTAGFSSGVATTAGSAVFNMLVIPAVVILAVIFKLKKSGITVSKKTVIRDGSFYVASILALILVLNQPNIKLIHGLFLLAIYAGYVFTLIGMNKSIASEEEVEEDDEDETTYESNSLKAFLKFDYISVFTKDGIITTKSAWIGLVISTIHVAIACSFLSEAVVSLAGSFGMPTFFVAVVLASAATSVPDTIMSLKDGMKGNYDDAISNAVGSNLFDICVSLGLPLTLYTLFNGSVTLGTDGKNVVELLTILVIVTLVALFFFLIPKKIGKVAAVTFIGIYVSYITYALARGAGVHWAIALSNKIPG